MCECRDHLQLPVTLKSSASLLRSFTAHAVWVWQACVHFPLTHGRSDRVAGTLWWELRSVESNPRIQILFIKIGLNWSDRHGCFVCRAGWHKDWLTHTHPGQHGYWIKWVFVNDNDENWATVRSDEPGPSTASASPFACYLANKRECLILADAHFTCSPSKFGYCCCPARSRLCVSVNSSDCLLSDAESSSSDSPVADKRAPGSERAAERAAQQNERERIRLAPQTSFANMQVHKHIQLTHIHTHTRFGGY